MGASKCGQTFVSDLLWSDITQILGLKTYPDVIDTNGTCTGIEYGRPLHHTLNVYTGKEYLVYITPVISS